MIPLSAPTGQLYSFQLTITYLLKLSECTGGSN